MFLRALALIAAACLFVALFRRAGLGSILGFLTAGVAVQLVDPLGAAGEPEALLHFAEFGVTLFLFVIGLELKPRELWGMRRDIFGLGLAQLLACGLVLGGAAWILGLAPTTAAVVGFGLAMSSTALVMRTLDERRARSAPHGRKAFSILLLQDLAIAPLLVMVSLFAPRDEAMSLEDGLLRLAIALAAIGALILAGRFLLDPMFRLLAKAGAPEIMTASALGVVIAAASVADLAGLSYAMGAFIAGVMLAESAYRHEVEADVEPFRGLLLGLFFIAVGLSIDVAAAAENWRLILVATPLAMAAKGLVVYAVARAFGEPHGTAARVALALPQFGEFGFVLFSAALGAALLDPATAAALVAIVTASMALSPLVARLEPLLLPPGPAETIEERFDDARGRVLIVGFGRFGQIVSQPLFAAGREVTILDRDAERVREAGGFGFRVHFGDGARRDVLRAAGGREVELIVVCVDDPETALSILALARAECAQAKVFVRSFDRRHSLRLMKARADFAVRETFESALRMGGEALRTLGLDEARVAATVDDVRRRDRERLRMQSEGDIRAGAERLHVRPEPLPRRAAEKAPAASD